MDIEAISGLWIVGLMLLAVAGAVTVGWWRGVKSRRNPSSE